MQLRTKRTLVVLGIVLVVAIFIASVMMLFFSARLQQSLLSQAPTYEPSTLYSRAVEQSAAGDYAAAEASLEQALQAQDDATYRSQLAVVKYRLKKYQESVELYQKLIGEGKDAAFAWNGIGNVYRDWADEIPAQAEMYQVEALAAYDKAITLNPQYVAAYSNAALLLANQGKQAEALAKLDLGIAKTSSPELTQTRARIAQK